MKTINCTTLSTKDPDDIISFIKSELYNVPKEDVVSVSITSSGISPMLTGKIEYTVFLVYYA